MNKLLALFVASAFALGSASGIAAEPAKKKEELSAEQKTEIRDRVERLKAERAKADAAKATTTTPAAPKADAPKKTSKAAKPAKRVAKADTGKAAKPAADTPAKAKPKA
jgi:hypothetical protein